MDDSATGGTPPGLTASAVTDTDETLALAAAELCGATHVACCLISAVADGDGEVLAAHGRRRPPHRRPGIHWAVDDLPPAHQAMDTRRTVVIADARDPRLSRSQRSRLYGNGDGTSVAIVPLVVDDAVVGIVELADDRNRDLAASVAGHEALVRLIADLVDARRRLAHAERRAADLALILDADIEAQSRTAGSDQVLRVIARRLAELCDAPMVDLSVVEPEAVRVVVSWERGRFQAAYEGSVFPLADWPAVRSAVLTGLPEVTRDRSDPRMSDAARAAMTEWGIVSSLVVPLRSQGQVIGVAEVHDDRPRDYADVLTAAGALCDVAAHTLDRVLLVEALESRNLTLREIVELGARVTQTNDPVALARYVAERLIDVVGATCCEIAKVEGGELRVLVSIDVRPGFDDPDATKPIDLEQFPSLTQAAREHDVLVVQRPDDPRLSDTEQVSFTTWGFRSELAIPLVVGERLVGLIDLFDEQGRDYAEYLDFARSVGQIVGGAFDNALLLERLATTNRDLRLLVDSAREFNASLDLDEVLRTVVLRMCDAAEADACDLYALEDDTMLGLVSADRDVIDAHFPGTRYNLSDYTAASRAVSQRQPYTVADVAEDPSVTRIEREENLHWGYRSILELPLIQGNEVIGVAAMYSKKQGGIPHGDLLLGLAQIAAQTIGNARVHRLLDESAARMSVLNEAGLDLAASLDLDHVLGSAARRLAQAVSVPACDIYILEGGQLVCMASVVKGERDDSWIGRRYRLDVWRAARLAVESRSVVTVVGPDDPRVAAAAVTGRAGPKSALIVPLVVEKRAIGVAELFEPGAQRGLDELFDPPSRRQFDPQEVASAEALCRVAALAIANAELYADLAIRTREAELLNRIAAITTASLDSGDIATASIGALAGLLSFDEVCLVIEHEGDWRVIYSSLPGLDGVAATMGHLLSSGLVGPLEEEHAVILDLTARPDVAQGLGGDPALATLLVVGLWDDRGLTGALALGRRRRDAFSETDRRLLARVGSQLALAFKNARLYETIKTMHVSNLKALITALNARDSYAVGHAARVAGYMLLLGRELGWHSERLPEITEAAFLHDVGRIGVADDVLFKPGRLSDAEMAELRDHPITSAEIVRPLYGEDIVLGIRHHHERWDGGGYPDGLRETDIPELARALCLVDSYDAMSYQRPHHPALVFEECVGELQQCRGRQFDPDMVDAFLRVLARLAERKTLAKAAAHTAASAVDIREHDRLTSVEDEGSAEYRDLVGVLRRIRDEHPPVRFLTTMVPGHQGWRMVGDPEEDEALHSHLGDLVLGIEAGVDEAAALDAERNVLHLDDFGIWVSALADLTDEHGETVGLACADLTPDDDWPTEFGRQIGSGAFAAVIESATTRLGRARVDAVTDGLTGLYNQRYFKQRAAEELARANEQGKPLSLLFCDIDRFKDYNDTHGHLAGDEALRAIANVLLRSLRQIDLAARYGGEEFAVLLIDTDASGAAEVAERVRAGIAQLTLATDGAGLTVSIGVSSYPRDAGLAEELVDKADWAMYLAKRTGRDRVVVFGPGAEPDG